VLPFGEGEEGKHGREGKGNGNGHFHVDMPTLLDGKNLSIDIARWYGFIRMRVNGHVDVAVQDGVCLDGVVQVSPEQSSNPPFGMSENYKLP
jgi:hypothetical protein